MVLGNVIAVVQPNIKRMLAYSSIAHAGYVAVAFAAASQRGVSAALFYLLAYSIMNLGAFAIVTMLEPSGRQDGQYRRLCRPGGKDGRGWLPCCPIFLLSLAGVPGTAGFAGKFFIFRAAVESRLIWLAIIGVVTTVDLVLLLPVHHRSNVHARFDR